jgi:excisionase family DNA binding protein
MLTDQTVSKEPQRRWADRNTDRIQKYKRAGDRVKAAVKAGLIVRGSACEVCGSTMGTIEAAHADYSKPLEVRWLCQPCHRWWDRNFPKTIAGRGADVAEAPPRLLTVVQAAEYLQVNVDTVRRWCRTGALRCTSLGDRAGYRIKQEDIDKFLEARSDTN